MSNRRVAPAGLTQVGIQRFAVNSTAVAINSTIRASSSALLISIETAPARIRSDSTAPTANTGVLLTTTSSPQWFLSYDKSANFKVVAAQSTAGVANIIGWKRPGDSA